MLSLNGACLFVAGKMQKSPDGKDFIFEETPVASIDDMVKSEQLRIYFSKEEKNKNENYQYFIVVGQKIYSTQKKPNCIKWFISRHVDPYSMAFQVRVIDKHTKEVLHNTNLLRIKWNGKEYYIDDSSRGY